MPARFGGAMVMKTSAVVVMLLLSPSSTAEQQPSLEAFEALGGDDDCAAREGEESCALNALQLRGQATGLPTDKDWLARGSIARSDPKFWAGKIAGGSFHSLGFQNELALLGYEWMATTTHYNNTNIASCGQLDTANLVAGTEYYSVASAEAMQYKFDSGSCCWCGESGPQCGHQSGTAPMGCASCARGRFIKKRPYESPFSSDNSIFDHEIKVVVADICPHTGNEVWCAPRPGTVNDFGSKNHLDFSEPPAGHDNFYFAFTPEPCSPEINRRLKSVSKCRQAPEW